MKSPLIIIRDSFEPKFICRICHTPFAQDEMHAFEHHVICCSNEHEAELMERSPRHSPFAEAPDPEWQAYNEGLVAQGLNPEVQYSRGRRSNIRRARES